MLDADLEVKGPGLAASGWLVNMSGIDFLHDAMYLMDPNTFLSSFASRNRFLERVIHMLYLHVHMLLYV